MRDAAELLASIQAKDKAYDADIKLLKVPMTKTYHTALKLDQHPFAYELYVATCYAFDLLQYGGEAYAKRAADILEVVIARQDQDPGRSTYGIWPYFDEEPLDEMDRPDWNMADFHGKKLVLILKNHAELLSPSLVDKLRAAVYHACQAIIIRNVGPHYTNIAIMGALVTLLGGELLGQEGIRSYGERRLRTFRDYTKAIGTFSEYNSPCYTPIAIEELHGIYAESSTAGAVADADELLDLAWHMIAKHYHPATGAWSGPHSRTYSTLLRPNEKAFLENALKQEQGQEEGQEQEKERGHIRCPEKYRYLFSSTEERYFTEPTLKADETGYQNYATTYQNERLSLGSYTSGIMWNQRRNLLGYVDSGGGHAVSIQLQFLKDGKDFCSAMFTGVQSRRQVLFALNLATDNGGWHQDLDIINGRFRAADLRIRLLLCGQAANVELPTTQTGARFATVIGETTLRVEAVVDRSDYGQLQLQTERSEEGLSLDYVISTGEERDFDFHALERAVWIFALSLGEDGPLPGVDIQSDESWLTASVQTDDGLAAITVPLQPRKTRELYQENKVQLPSALLGK
ncbi:hypothetical protein [Cohnella hashimotonis]|uniref:Heparinase II/III-like protein n=1 Tax=Cohnella hashimotonis TaxID=2826895 RepID=A0ABT6TSI4_9BACL|nr:hypothetical protein [Cohnella hashimotonis]MDI4648762.1 hypothetical protein [Cohnella hashimotonis]